MTIEQRVEQPVQSEGVDFSFLDPDAVLTPAQVDWHMKLLNNELARAQMALRSARYVEIQDLRNYELAKAPLILDPDCPVPSKTAGVTKAQRDEWINHRLPDLWWKYQGSKVVRMTAVDYNKRLAEQRGCLQTIAANARQAYEIVGRTS